MLSFLSVDVLVASSVEATSVVSDTVVCRGVVDEYSEVFSVVDIPVVEP